MNEEFDDDENLDSGCYNCGGSGFVITCCDDICRGTGYCMHGDGMEDCPVCNRDGEKEWIE